MLTLDDEYDKARSVVMALYAALGRFPPSKETRFDAEWSEASDALDDLIGKASALRDKIAAMEEG